MKRTQLLAAAFFAGGTALIAWGLASPLVSVPGVPTLRFHEQPLGGVALTCGILVLLVLATVLFASRDRLRRTGVFCGGLGLGVAFGSLLAIGRYFLDKLKELNDMSGQPSADVKAIMALMKPGPGSYILAAGFALCLAGAVWALWTSDEAKA